MSVVKSKINKIKSNIKSEFFFLFFFFPLFSPSDFIKPSPSQIFPFLLLNKLIETIFQDQKKKKKKKKKNKNKKKKKKKKKKKGNIT